MKKIFITRVCNFLKTFMSGALALSFLSLCLTTFLPLQDTQAADVSTVSQSEAAELASELTNPLADLMILPIQVNYDEDIGPQDDGWKVQTNVQPVIPFHLSEDWNLITRTIIPVTHQEDIFPGAGSQFGLGDTLLNLFFSPVEPTSNGIIWGAGPMLLLPTATDSLLGSEKWGAGPTTLVLKKRGSWTAGFLASRIWSFAGDSDRRDVNSSQVQPFAAYTWPNSAWSASIQSESVYDWKAEEWSIPVNLTLAKLVWWGRLPVRLQAGIGYWVDSKESGPEGFRSQFQLNFVLPK